MSVDATALPSMDQLVQLPLPAPVSYWPQTWGWWAVLAVALLLAAWLVWHGVRKHRRNRYRRAGLQRLEALRQAAQADVLAARELPALLKRVGLSSLPPAQRAQVGALAGDAWLAFLARNGGEFAPDTQALLHVLAYAPPDTVRAIAPARLQGLFAASRQWMERHHVAA